MEGMVTSIYNPCGLFGVMAMKDNMTICPKVACCPILVVNYKNRVSNMGNQM